MKTVAVWTVAALLALPLAGPGPAQPPAAPAPRPAAGEVSLFVVEGLNTPGRGIERQRIIRVGFRNGVVQPPEVRWEGPWDIDLGHGARFVRDRYVVTREMSVIDLTAGKDINGRSGELLAVDGDEVA